MIENKSNKAQLWSVIISMICIVIAGVLAIKTFNRVENRPLPIPRDSNINLIQGWMSIKYISKAYNIPEKIILEKLAINIQKEGNMPLIRLAKKRGTEINLLIGEITQIIVDFHSSFQLVNPENPI